MHFQPPKPRRLTSGPKLEELLTNITKYVHKNEPDTLKYELHKQINPDGEAVYVVLEAYKNEKAVATHRASEPYMHLFATAEKEGLVGAAPTIVESRSIAGFASR